MQEEIKKILENRQKTQKWDCYKAHPDGYIMAAGWPDVGLDLPYTPEVRAKANAHSKRKWAELSGFATDHAGEHESEESFAAAAKAAGVA